MSTDAKNIGIAWDLEGNEGIDPSTDFIGTIDAIDFPIKTNSLLRQTIKSTGETEITAVADYTPLILKGFSSQTANLLELQDSVGTELFVIDKNGDVGIGKAVPTNLICIEQTRNETAVIRVQHTQSNEDTRLDLRTAGGGNADPYIRLAICGATTWSVGVDDSDSDSFKIANFTSPGTNARIKIEKAGKVIVNKQLSVGAADATIVQFQLLARSGQSANILQVGEDSGDVDKFFVIDEVGRVGIGVSIDPAARLNVQGSIDEVQTLIKGFSTQTTNLLELKNSSDVVQFSVDNNGNGVFKGNLEADKRDVLRYAILMGS